MSDALDLHEDVDEPARLDPRLWGRVLSLAAPYRRQLVALGASGAVMAAFDAVLPWLTGVIIDGATGGDTGLIVRGVAGYTVAVVGIGVLIWTFIVIAGRVATGYAHDVRRDGFGRLQELSFSFFDTRPVGWLMARMTSDCAKLSNVIPWSTLDLVWGTSLIVGISVMMLSLDVRLALYVMLIVPPLALVSVFFQRRLLESQRLVRRTNSRITASFNEGIMGVPTTKTLVREVDNQAEFDTLTGTMFAASVRNALQAAVYLPIVITLGSFGVGIALWKGGLDVQVGGLSYGTLVAFMQYAALFYMPIQELAQRFTELQAAQASAERLIGLLETEPAIRDAPDVLGRLAADRPHQRAAGLAEDGHDAVIETIAFRDVGFEYVPGEPVLRRVDLTVNAGDTIALVGATGGGKSTIVNLVCRFYEPTSGRIEINGVDYRRRGLRWLQSNLGMVLQTPHLFSGSILDNIRYGRLDATEAEVRAAAEVANAHAFIDGMPEGYLTEVGEGGSRLSTGQKQLVSLARAVLADPQIFVMDEATSSVDTETEQLIQAGIDAVLRGRISFVIAHRLSTIRAADRILVIDGGEIVEAGSHEELLAARGRYHALYTNQFVRGADARFVKARAG